MKLQIAIGEMRSVDAIFGSFGSLFFKHEVTVKLFESLHTELPRCRPSMVHGHGHGEYLVGNE